MQRLRTRLRAGATAFPPATFALNFLTGALDSGVTFSRGSNATLVDSTGKITYAPANLFLQSQTFDSASWTKSNTTVVADATTAPDGTSTADKLVEDTATSGHDARQTVTVAAAIYTYSIYLKASERSLAFLFTNNGNVGTVFDLSNGTTAGNAGFSAPTSASITSVGNGWYRCSITLNATAASSSFRVFTMQNSTTQVYTGDGTSGIFIWGAQLEPVTYQTTPGTYNATTAAAYYGPRFDYDPVTLAAKGLLIEEQRTNLVLYSEQFDNATWTKSAVTITANATAAPDGTSTADKLTPDVTLASHFAGQTVTTTAVAHTYSAYLKAGGYSWAILYAAGVNQGVYFDLANGVVGSSFIGAPTSSSITPVGNGWYRCSITFTATTGTAARVYASSANTVSTFAGDGTSGIFIWGAQLEAGAFATSYIPTVASTVTRSADVATMTGTNFSSWYNQSEGTFVASADTAKPPSVATANFIAIASDGTQNERVQNVIDTSNVTAGVIDGNVSQANFTNAYTLNQILNSAIAYKVNDFAASFNGGTVATDTSGTIPTVNRMTLGSSWDGANFFLNGHIRSIAYYNTRLPNAQLQALTA